MKHFLKYLFSFILIIMTCCACNKEESVILFNKQPFSYESVMSQNNTNVFRQNERIYYLITLPKIVETQQLLIQVVKSENEEERLGYDLVWTKRVRLRTEEAHYYTDYFTFNEKGAYGVKIYSRDNPTQILTTAKFYIK